MKIPKSLHEQLVALLERPDLFAVNVEAPDRVSLAFEAAGLSLPETRTTLFFDDKHNGLDLLLPPELSAVTIEKIRSLKERGTRVDELAVELRENYLAVQRQRIHALGVERLRFELDAVEKLRGEALFRANPQDSSPVVIVEIPILVSKPIPTRGSLAHDFFKLRVTYFLNAAKDSLSRVERQLLPGIHGSPLPQFPRPLPAFSSQSFLFDYVPILREWLQYELYPPADLVERRKRLLAQIALEFRSQLLEVDDAAQVAVLFVEALGGPSASHHVGSSQLGPASSTAICRIDVANANRDVPPVVTLISPYASVRGKANVPLSREITAMLRWDWKLPVEEDVAAFRLVSAGDLFPFSV